jgi:syntaxin-binding protein 1
MSSSKDKEKDPTKKKSSKDKESSSSSSRSKDRNEDRDRERDEPKKSSSRSSDKDKDSSSKSSSKSSSSSSKSKKEKKELPTSNLRELVKARLLAMFDELPGEDDNMWKVLIVDKYTLSVISAACRVRDILQKNITIVEYLHKSRQPFPQMGGVYFISPEEESVAAFLKDFEDPSKPRYSCAHLFFSSRVSNKIMKMIGESKASVRVKTLTEVNIDFLAIEQKAFSLNTLNDMKLAFGDQDKKGFVENLSSKLLTFCLTYGQIPYIRHSASSTLATNVAEALQDKLGKLKGDSDTKLESKNSVLLIVDRGEDPLVPLLHDFYYQAMAFDLMKIGEDCIYTQQTGDKEKSEKKVILDEYDPIWLQHRHTHFGELGPIIKKDFDTFMEEHKDINDKDKDKLKQGSNLQNMIRKLPQYREKIDQFNLHINLTRELLYQFRQQQLNKVALEEQNMAVGSDPDNKKISNVLTTISPILSSNEISVENKLRLVMIYLITQGGINDDKKGKLLKMAKLDSSDNVETIENLKWLGVQLNKSMTIANKISNLFDALKNKKKQDVEYHLSRYVPKLKDIAEQMLEEKLSLQDYPYIKEPSSTFKLAKPKEGKKDSKDKGGEDLSASSSKSTSKGPSWDRLGSSSKESSSSSKSDKDRNKTKLILFVIGGMTYPEMRAAYDLDKDYKLDVIIGSTSILTPQRYLQKLGNLRGEKTRGRRAADSDDELSD